MTSDTPPDGAPPPASADPPTVTRREPRHSKRVVLQADVAVDGRRNMSVEQEGDDVVIRGHDLGPVVTRAWGRGHQRVRVGLADSGCVVSSDARRAWWPPGR
jgi:hypothetical protein